ncbi:MAG: hypothetical protein HYY06_29065 [Deltaproteobacteria bacterium]|nr:hypothetical protein [Deltaproteobacteria bacterium]
MARKDLEKMLCEIRRDLELSNRRFEEMLEERGLSLDELEALADHGGEVSSQALRTIEEMLDGTLNAEAPRASAPRPLGLRI